MFPFSLAARLAAAAALLAVIGVVAGPAVGARSHATGTAVTVTATEFHFKFSKATVPHGSVTFTVVNKGHVSHDFKIGGKKTPLIKPGKSAKLTVTLKKGKAAYLCTVAGHAAAGMKGSLTVK
jgi:plastocyanin